MRWRHHRGKMQARPTKGEQFQVHRDAMGPGGLSVAMDWAVRLIGPPETANSTAAASRRQLTPRRNLPCSSLPPVPLGQEKVELKGWKGWMRRRRHSGDIDRVAARVPHATLGRAS